MTSRPDRKRKTRSKLRAEFARLSALPMIALEKGSPGSLQPFGRRLPTGFPDPTRLDAALESARNSEDEAILSRLAALDFARGMQEHLLGLRDGIYYDAAHSERLRNLVPLTSPLQPVEIDFSRASDAGLNLSAPEWTRRLAAHYRHVRRALGLPARLAAPALPMAWIDYGNQSSNFYSEVTLERDLEETARLLDPQTWDDVDPLFVSTFRLQGNGPFPRGVANLMRLEAPVELLRADPYTLFEHFEVDARYYYKNLLFIEPYREQGVIGFRYGLDAALEAQIGTMGSDVVKLERDRGMIQASRTAQGTRVQALKEVTTRLNGEFRLDYEENFTLGGLQMMAMELEELATM